MRIYSLSNGDYTTNGRSLIFMDIEDTGDTEEYLELHLGYIPPEEITRSRILEVLYIRALIQEEDKVIALAKETAKTLISDVLNELKG
tara:strand:+ start:975 stop:1238 length:264 start_codon:yes stop_codon:yes gene_type:complete